MPELDTPGTCALCNHTAKRDQMVRHLADCAVEHDWATGPSSRLLYLRVRGQGDLYWLDLEAREEATLQQLDRMLRRVWVECCQHPSAFRIGGRVFASPRATEILQGERGEQGAGGARPAIAHDAVAVGPFDVRIAEALDGATEFFYDYDFVHTTRLRLELVGERQGSIGEKHVRTLARNDEVVWPCPSCDAPAVWICPACLESRQANPFACRDHASEHPCVAEAIDSDDEDDGTNRGAGEGPDLAELLLPVVNSPRMGVCRYRDV